MRILLLTLSLLFSQELEVQGDLKVSGNIDVQNNPIKNVGIPQELTDAINGNVLQDALRDDGNYEYMYFNVRFVGALGDDAAYPFNISYKNVGDSSYLSNWTSHLNTLIVQGWKISNVFFNPGYGGNGIHMFAVYELKRSLEEE